MESQILTIGMPTAIMSVADLPTSSAEFHILAVCGSLKRYDPMIMLKTALGSTLRATLSGPFYSGQPK